MDGSCSGSYYSSMYISANFNPAVAGDLHIDTRTCLPCHRLCATCTGPRLESGECETCKYAKKNGTCAESCNNETGGWVQQFLKRGGGVGRINNTSYSANLGYALFCWFFIVPVVIHFIGERAKRARHYQGCTNSS